jgi:pimeloyl-ACP methyl ester carboxylesterase
VRDAGCRAAIFLHGAGGGGWEWLVWQRLFAAGGFAVSALDLMPAASGLAQTRLQDYSLQAATAIASWPRPRVVVGASLGGLLAVVNADLADALVLVNPLPPTPWHGGLPVRGPYPAIVRWGREASLSGTRRALPDADDATCLYAFRRWRDESGAALDEARAGIPAIRPRCPCLVIASGRDEDVPMPVSVAFAEGIGADLVRLPEASHVGPLLGRGAAGVAQQAVAWLNGLPARA